MLVRLTTSQIADYWGYIKHGIRESVDEEILLEQDQFNNMLEALLSGAADCWFYLNDEQDKVKGCVITTASYDGVAKEKVLRIYSVYVHDPLTSEEWKDGFGTLTAHAKHEGCKAIDAITSLRGIVHLADRLGGNTKHSYIIWRL